MRYLRSGQCIDQRGPLRGRGGGLSDMFGGGVTSNLGSSGVAEKNLNRITVWIALVWALSIVAIGVLIELVGFGPVERRMLKRRGLLVTGGAR